MTEDMPRTRLPFLRHEKNRHGVWCWYFRRGRAGKRIRIRGEYKSPEFMAAYNAALAGKPLKSVGRGPATGTVLWLVEAYKKSAHFSNLAESTRRLRDNILKKLIESSGDKQFANITKRHIIEALDRRAATPNAANNFLTIVSQMFDWAASVDKISVNPCAGVKRISVDTDGFHSWTEAEVEQYQKRHPVGTKARLALDILLFVGLRRSDLVRLGRQHVRDGVITIKTIKTGAEVSIPIFPELAKSIKETPTGDLAFLTSATGLPFASGGSFANWFRSRCDEAGLSKECSAHGLRKAGAAIAANEGASARELMAMYGWERITTAEHYTKAADKVRLARAAAERIANRNAPHRESECGNEAEKAS